MVQISGAASANAFSPGIIRRVAAGLSLALTGRTPSWFGPGEPLLPAAPPEVAGRRFDYPVSTNINYTPRTEINTSGVTFDQLRNLADSCDILRLVVETRKDQVAKMTWSIKAKKEGQGSEADIEAMTDFFSFPDGETDFHNWLRRLLEDLFVVDAPSLYIRRTKGRKVLGFEPIDGATIKRVLDEGGRTPAPPDPAYQQILKGLPAADLTTDDLVYAPRNLRNHMIYGYGPVEQIIVTVNMAIRRTMSQLAYFTDGSMPAGIATTPENWTAEQIEQFQDYWDSLLAGNDQQKRRLRFVPAQTSFTSLKPDLLKDEMDEWLGRVICYAFSVSNQPFVKQMNRATAANAQEQAIQEGLAPVLLWAKSLVNRLLRSYLGHPELEFNWDEEEEQNPLEQAQIDQILVNTGIMTIDEARDKRGMEPLPKEPLQPAGPLAVPVDPTQPEPAHQGKATVAPGAAPAQAPAPPAEKVAKVSVKMQPRPQHEAAVRRVFKKWFRAQTNKVAAQITAQLGKVAKGDEARADKILAGVDLNTEPLIGQLLPIYQEAWVAAAADATQGLPDDRVPDEMLEVVNEAGVAWAKQHVGNLITNISQGTKDFIRTDVAEALNEGHSTAQLADTLADSYAFSDDRAQTIARTEMTDALVQGTLATWRESGVVVGKRWLVGDGCCDDCEALDGETVGLEEEFPDDGGDGPPAHPNCRCTLIAILDNEKDGEA